MKRKRKGKRKGDAGRAAAGAAAMALATAGRARRVPDGRKEAARRACRGDKRKGDE